MWFPIPHLKQCEAGEGWGEASGKGDNQRCLWGTHPPSRWTDCWLAGTEGREWRPSEAKEDGDTDEKVQISQYIIQQ
jgi:hypothetical protein